MVSGGGKEGRAAGTWGERGGREKRDFAPQARIRQALASAGTGLHTFSKRFRKSPRSVADDPGRSVIQEQVEMGVAVRMAVMEALLDPRRDAEGAKS